MWDQLLSNLDHATTPKEAISLWHGDTPSLQFISQGINVVYRFEIKNRGYYLRITHQQLRNQEELSAAIDFQAFLSSHHVPICKPVKSINQRYIEVIQQASNIFLAHVSEEVPGSIIQFNNKETLLYKTWGRTIAQLHAASMQYQSLKQFQFKSAHDLHHELRPYTPSEDSTIQQAYHTVEQWLDSLNKDKQLYGLTHGDHRCGNVLWDSNDIHIIDFDEPIYHWFLADVARPFLEHYFEPIQNIDEKFNHYLDGYCSILPLDNQQLKQIPWFIKMKALDMYLWTKHNWQGNIVPGGASKDKMLTKLKRLIETSDISWCKR